MKPFILLTVTFFIQSWENSFSQDCCFPVKKVYAYFQPVSQGVTSKEEGKKKAVTGNFYVYVDSKKENITLNNIWIKGLLYNGHLQEVKKQAASTEPKRDAPILESGNPSDIVPATKNKLYMVMFTALEPNKLSSLPNKYSSKPFVIELQHKKKRKYFTLDEIKQITSAAMY